MYAADTYRIRIATVEDWDTLRRLARQSTDRPLLGRVLIGEIEGVGAAALSLDGGRVIAEPGTEHLVANLRVRAASIHAYEDEHSLNRRLLAGLPVWYRALAARTSPADDETAEHEPVLVYS